MDPVTAIGLVASVDQLAGLAKAIVANMYGYFEAVKDAPQHSKELRREMTTIYDLLESIQNTLLTNPESAALASLNDSIADFRDMLIDMKERVAPERAKGIRRLKWPFTKEENEKLLSRIGRYKDTFNLILTIQSA